MSGNILVAESGGHLFLAEKHKQGLQMDIENFASWQEAERWCHLHRQEPTVQIDGVALTRRQCTLLSLLSAEPQSLLAVHERMSQHELGLYAWAHAQRTSREQSTPSPPSPPDTIARKLPGKTATRNALLRLEQFFLVHMHREQKGFETWVVTRTTVGQRLLDEIDPM